MANCSNKRTVFKTSEARTKAWFRTNGLIDKYMNILDLKEFLKQNTKWSNYAKITYGVDGRLFSTDKNGKIAYPNKDVFNKIDEAQIKKGEVKPFKRDLAYYNGDKQLMQQEEGFYQLDTPIKPDGSAITVQNILDSPTQYQKGYINNNLKESEFGIRDLAARLAARIGSTGKFSSDLTKDYAGWSAGNQWEINLA